MTAPGYEFYLRVHFRNSKTVQLNWSPIVKCLSQKCYETRIKSYKGEIKTVILIFFVSNLAASRESHQ